MERSTCNGSIRYAAELIVREDQQRPDLLPLLTIRQYSLHLPYHLGRRTRLARRSPQLDLLAWTSSGFWADVILHFFLRHYLVFRGVG